MTIGQEVKMHHSVVLLSYGGRSSLINPSVHLSVRPSCMCALIQIRHVRHRLSNAVRATCPRSATVHLVLHDFEIILRRECNVTRCIAVFCGSNASIHTYIHIRLLHRMTEHILHKHSTCYKPHASA